MGDLLKNGGNEHPVDTMSEFRFFAYILIFSPVFSFADRLEIVVFSIEINCRTLA